MRQNFGRTTTPMTRTNGNLIWPRISSSTCEHPCCFCAREEQLSAFQVWYCAYRPIYAHTICLDVLFDFLASMWHICRYRMFGSSIPGGFGEPYCF